MSNQKLMLEYLHPDVFPCPSCFRIDWCDVVDCQCPPRITRTGFIPVMQFFYFRRPEPSLSLEHLSNAARQNHETALLGARSNCALLGRYLPAKDCGRPRATSRRAWARSNCWPETQPSLIRLPRDSSRCISLWRRRKACARRRGAWSSWETCTAAATSC